MDNSSKSFGDLAFYEFLAELLGASLSTYSGVRSTYSSGLNEAITTSGDSTSEQPKVVTGISMFGGTAMSVASPVAEIGPFWQDSSGGWHLGNVVPYSRVEKNAEQLYNTLHRNQKQQDEFPVIVAESADVFEAAEIILGGRTPGSMDRTLEILEKALSYETEADHTLF